MTKKQEGISRRQFVAGAAALGGTLAAMPLLADERTLPFGAQSAQGAGSATETVSADRVIYTTCEQCQTFCTIKVTLSDPAVTGGKTYIRKIAGNPYSPLSMVPFGQIPYATSPAEAVKGHGNVAVDGRSFAGGRTCLKGQAGIQTAYDAYRLAQPLKRVGPRGSGTWQTVPWEQAIAEIAAAVKPSLGYVPEEPVMADWALVKEGKITKAEFDAKYKEVLIDTNHPDLGPKSNQIAFLSGNRLDFMGRMVKSTMGSMNLFNHGGICGVSGVAANVRTRNGNGLKKRQYADMDYTQYLVVFGSNPVVANKGPTWLAPTLTNALARGMKLVVVDPRLSKTAEKAHLWVPVKPGGDMALALGMIRWIISNQRFDARYLTNPGKQAATAAGEPTWSDATHLVNVSAPNRPKLKAKELGLGGAKQFVALQEGQPVAADSALEGQLEVDTEINGMRVKSAFTLLKERVLEKSMKEYAEAAGVSEATIAEMARDFTDHGKRAVAISYRGPAMHTNGFHAVAAIGILNFLIGNHDWKGGENSSAVRYNEKSGRHAVMKVPKGRVAWGLPITREKGIYEKSTLFARDGYPAKRRWTFFGGNFTHEVIPSAYDGYPYSLQALFINRISPVESVAGGQFQAEMLKDETRIPLVVSFDVVVGGTSQFADYILPDLSYLERWNLEGIYPNQNLKESHLVQPAIKVMDGPRAVEDVLIDIAAKAGLSGVGVGAFADGSALNRAEDFYLKMAANIAYDETPVPDASAEEERIFVQARKHALGDSFDEARWKSAVKPEEWSKVIYLLNRGGRFAPKETAYEGDWLKMRFGGQCNLYDEVVARTKDSYSGSFFDGLPHIDVVKDFSGKPVLDNLPLHLINWKSSHLSNHRTIGNAWLREIRYSNPIWIHPRDAAARGLKSGDRVKVRSADYEAETEVLVTESIRPGVVGADFSYGHETYGAKAITIDEVEVPPVNDYGHSRFAGSRPGLEPTGYAPGRGTGFRINDVIRQDPSMPKGNPLSDPIGGSCSQYDTRVEVVKAASL